MISSVRRCFGAAAVGAIAFSAVTFTASDAHASSTVTYPTGYVYTGANALAECQAKGQSEVSQDLWDGYSCKPDSSAPGAIRLWVIIWVGCPTC
jgi:hypothetical protein